MSSKHVNKDQQKTKKTTDSSNGKEDSSSTESSQETSKNLSTIVEIPIVKPLQATENISLKPICRICFGAGSSEKLVSPCECKGSIGFVHKNCLEHWLGTRNTDKCELCNYRYATFRTRKRLWDWCIDPSTQTDRKNFLGDILCFLFLTPLGAASFYLCVRGAYYFYEFEKGVLEATSLVGLAAFLAFAYSTWMVLSVKYHYAAWKSWRMRSWNIRVLIPDDSQISVVHVNEDNQNYINSKVPPISRNVSEAVIAQPRAIPILIS